MEILSTPIPIESVLSAAAIMFLIAFIFCFGYWAIAREDLLFNRSRILPLFLSAVFLSIAGTIMLLGDGPLERDVNYWFSVLFYISLSFLSYFTAKTHWESQNKLMKEEI